MKGVPWWVVGSLFLLWRQRLKFLAKLPLFNSKIIRQNSPLFLGSVSQVMAKSV
jgi:hypothetical protein